MRVKFHAYDVIIQKTATNGDKEIFDQCRGNRPLFQKISMNRYVNHHTTIKFIIQGEI